MLKNKFKQQSLTHCCGFLSHKIYVEVIWNHNQCVIIIIHRFYIFLILFSECNCNEFSHRCFFDKELYDRTGHGGHCLDCAGNRDGANCERCKENYYQRKGDSHCSPCECNEVGKCRMQQLTDFSQVFLTF